jgi:arylsulfatase A-like enzyme
LEEIKMALKEYKPGTAFSGVIGRTFDVSSPAWPEPLRAKEGAPNVLFIVLDDVGFGQIGCFGGPCETPNLDALAKNGLRYNNMHTTALCSPTRSCLITGRNHHSNAMSCITEGSTGYPGGNGNIPFENGFLSEMLLQHGYNTYAIGKWHLTPADQISAAGPYDRWPLGRGFERFYGFLGRGSRVEGRGKNRETRSAEQEGVDSCVLFPSTPDPPPSASETRIRHRASDGSVSARG